MPRKIKDVFDDNPALGNDPTIDFVVPVDEGDAVARTRSVSQLANAIAYILGLTGNAGTPTQLRITPIVDTLLAKIDPIIATYTYWVRKTDDTSSPNPGDGVEGSLPTLYQPFSQFNVPQVEYFYISIDNIVFTQLIPVETQSDGAAIPGIIIQAIDTIGPVVDLTTLELAASDVDASKGFKYKVNTPFDAGSGLNYVVLHYAPDDSVFLDPVAIFDAFVEVAGRIPGETISLYPVAYDNANPPNVSGGPLQAQSITLAANVGGVVSIVDAVYSASEADGTLNIPLSITGRSAGSGDTIANVALIDRTTSGQVALAAGTVTFPNNNQANQNAVINLTNSGANTNNVCELQLTAVDNGATLGSNLAELVGIDGTGGSVLAFAQPDIATDADGVIVFEAEDFHRILTGTDSSWFETTGIAGFQGTGAMNQNSGTTYFTAPFVGAAPGFETNIDIHTDHAGVVHYIWARMRAIATLNKDVWVGTDELDNLSPPSTALRVPLNGTSEWRWVKHTATFTPVAGLTTIDFWKNEADCQIDRVAITRSNTYTPYTTLPTEAGPTATTETTAGSAPDNPDNPTDPIGPAPATGAIAPTTQYPKNGAGPVLRSSDIWVEYAGYSQVTVSEFKLVYNTTLSITGQVVITGNRVSLRPSVPLPENTVFTPSITAQGVDSNQALQNLGEGTWSFTSVNPSSELLHIFFENRAIGLYSTNDLKADCQWNTALDPVNNLPYSQGNGGNGVVNPSTEIVVEPTGVNPSFGKCLRIWRPINKAGAGDTAGGLFIRADFARSQEVYYAIKFVRGDQVNGYIPVMQEKFPGIITSTILDASHAFNAPPGGSSGTVSFTNLMQIDDARARAGRGDNHVSSYFYDDKIVQRNNFYANNDPTAGLESDQYHMPVDFLFKEIETHTKMNTVTPSVVEDGKSEAWVDGVLKLSVDKQWRNNSNVECDGLWVYFYYGGDPTNPDNKAVQTQYIYVAEILVSLSPITH